MGLQLIVTDRGMLIGQRKKLGLSQEDVAKKAGIKLEQYQRYENTENGFSSSSLRIVNAVLTALELDTTSFAKGEYALEPLPEDAPLNKVYAEYLKSRGERLD
jgi:transcriptional regulator with XRE-family HTH domain